MDEYKDYRNYKVLTAREVQEILKVGNSCFLWENLANCNIETADAIPDILSITSAVSINK